MIGSDVYDERTVKTVLYIGIERDGAEADWYISHLISWNT